MRRTDLATYLALALALPLSLAGLASEVAAQDEAARAQAREHFTAGVARYEAADYRAALESFQEAYRIAPHPTVRVNMANCYEHLGRPLEAIHHFERFLAESQNANRDQRREVETAMRRLQAQLGEVSFSIAPDGATITIDDAETRRAPVLEPVRLTTGIHRVVVRLEGYRTVRREVDVRGGTTERVAVQLERGSDSAVVATTQPVRPTPATTGGAGGSAGGSVETTELDDPLETSEGSETTGEADPEVGPEEPSAGGGGGWQLRITEPVIATAAVTGGLLLGAIITGVVAVAANDSFESAVVRYETATNDADRSVAQQDGLSAADLANAMSIVSDVFLIATIAAAGATAFFVVVEGMDSGNTQEDSLASAGPRLRAAPMASPDGGGLMLVGQY